MLRFKKAMLIILFLFGLKNISEAQNKFWQKITIRKAFETKTSDDSKPAIASFTMPKDTANSFLINAGAGYDFFKYGPHESNKATGFFVYNRNTLIAKKQKNYKLGISVGNVLDLNDNPTTAIIGASTLQYLRNYIDSTHSLIATSYWHLLIKKASLLHIGGYISAPHIFDYFILPSLGIEYQKIIDATSKSKKGYDARGYFSFGFHIRIKKKSYFSTVDLRENLLDSLSQDQIWQTKSLVKVKDTINKMVPFGTRRVMDKDTWTKLFEFTFDYTARASVISHQSNFDSYIPLFTAGINIFPFHDENFSFGLSYNNGANPIDGAIKQTFWLFSITFKK